MNTPLEKVTEAGGLLIDAVNQLHGQLTGAERVAFRNALRVLGELEDVISQSNQRRRLYLVDGGGSP